MVISGIEAKKSVIKHQIRTSRTRQHWNQIEIEVSWCPTLLNYDDDVGAGHLEVRSISPEQAALPISETGYRSHFIHPNQIAEHGGPDEFVRLWLDHAAQSPAWHDAVTASLQARGSELSVIALQDEEPALS